jgi:hypothetical protein
MPGIDPCSRNIRSSEEGGACTVAPDKDGGARMGLRISGIFIKRVAHLRPHESQLMGIIRRPPSLNSIVDCEQWRRSIHAGIANIHAGVFAGINRGIIHPRVEVWHRTAANDNGSDNGAKNVRGNEAGHLLRPVT